MLDMLGIKAVVFRIGNENYGVDIKVVCGIEKTATVIPIPNSNSNIEGIINLRGDVIPVFSLRNKFGMPKIEKTEETKFIIVKSGKLCIALEVDKIEEIQEIDECMINDLPIIIKNQETGYVDRIVNKDGRIIVLININELLSEEEIAELNKSIEEQ